MSLQISLTQDKIWCYQQDKTQRTLKKSLAEPLCFFTWRRGEGKRWLYLLSVNSIWNQTTGNEWMAGLKKSFFSLHLKTSCTTPDKQATGHMKNRCRRATGYPRKEKRSSRPDYDAYTVSFSFARATTTNHKLWSAFLSTKFRFWNT